MRYLHLTDHEYLDGIDVATGQHQSVLTARLRDVRGRGAAPRILRAVARDHGSSLIHLDVTVSTSLDGLLALVGKKRTSHTMPTLEFRPSSAPRHPTNRSTRRSLILQRVANTIAFNAHTPQEFLDALVRNFDHPEDTSLAVPSRVTPMEVGR